MLEPRFSNAETQNHNRSNASQSAAHTTVDGRLEGAKQGLIRRSQAFAVDDPARSWSEFWISFPPLFLTLSIGALELFPGWLRLLASVFSGLLMMRVFVIYHDYMHGAILQNSRAARWVMSVVGTLLLRTPFDWRRSHNFHHQNNCRFEKSEIGSFKLMSKAEYLAATPSQQRNYRIIRNPLVIVFGYFTCFLLEAVKKLFFKEPALRIQSAIALAVHIALGYWAYLAGWDVFLYAFFLPYLFTSAVGVCLFYLQHNFPQARFRNGEEWSHEYAALQSSSMLESGPVFRWFSANIGYHHIHHLNHKIPFYRLPEAMAALPELSQPHVVRLTWKNLADCLRLKLWDEDKQKLVPFPN